MQRALTKLRAAEGSTAWPGAVFETSVTLSRGVATLLESLRAAEILNQNQLRAQKFARLRVAEIQLYAADQVAAGRAAGNLYSTLRAAIDEARKGFQREFLTQTRGIPDYLHEELVRVLAHNNEALLGPDYPGPLN